MRTSLLPTLLVVLAVAACISATSPPRCDNVNCAEATCQPVDCKCGSYKGSCGCCDFCYKCPGDVCTPLFQERCSDGHTCELDEPGTIAFGGKGKCKPPSSS
ncbi:8.6 kDa transglutaminase substrate-like [Dermacentor andersoni]|uniref:8.6 kDa transglutaminase substrate-like n=1 Tax=Dermacentor andersoni TaxID=34620 RepID=UPI0021558FAE|nr:8.6 kDa transglutaminase substrate-like [Dermacentor andersoni]